MPYTILSARFANPEHTAVVALTAEAAEVLLCETEDGGLWPAVLAAAPEPYEPPSPAPQQALPPVVPEGAAAP